MKLTSATWVGVALACALMLWASAGVADAAEIKVLSGTGPRAAVRELVAQFERATRHKVAVRFDVNAAVKRTIEAGETFDAAILNPEVLDDLIRQGKVTSRATIGRSGFGVAVRAGAARPDISSVDAFRRALLNATSVAFPKEGASGVYFMGLLARLGIADAMKFRLRPMPASDTVEIVARGEADLVVVVLPRISDAPGVDLVGPLPAELQTRIGFAAGVGAAAREPGAAKALVEFLAAPAAAPVLRAKGIEPG